MNRLSVLVGWSAVLWLGCAPRETGNGVSPSSPPVQVQVPSAIQPPAKTETSSAKDTSARNAPAAAALAQPPAPSWPCWRGPLGDGISRDTNWSTDWPKDGPPVVWRASVGIGFSSFSVGEGRVYTMGNTDERESVYCFDAKSGQSVWTKTYPARLLPQYYDGGPGATPTIDEDRVYALGKEGQLQCFAAATGEIRWQRDLQRDLGQEVPEWGFESSPLIIGEKLLLEAGRVIAYDKRTGETLWQTSRKFAPGYGTPCLFTQQGEQLVATLNNDRLQVVRVADGKEIAGHDWKSDFATNSTTPIVDRDTIFISSGYKRGCALLRLKENTLEPIYEHKQMSNHFNNCVLWQGHLYGIDGNSHNPRLCRLVCLEFATGKVAWHQRGFGCGSVLLNAAGKLIVLSDEGELVIAEASPQKFEPIARAKVLDGLCWTVPTLAGGRLYCRNSTGNAVCLDVAKK